MKDSAKLAIISTALGIDMDALIDEQVRKSMNGHSKYRPHQGKKEQERRLKALNTRG